MLTNELCCLVFVIHSEPINIRETRVPQTADVLSQVPVMGQSGYIVFGNEGDRVNLTLTISNFRDNKFVKVKIRFFAVKTRQQSLLNSFEDVLANVAGWRVAFFSNRRAPAPQTV